MAPSERRTRIPHALLNGAERVVRHAPCPVLSVARDHDGWMVRGSSDSAPGGAAMSHVGAGFPFPIALCEVTACVRSSLPVAFPLHSLVAMTALRLRDKDLDLSRWCIVFLVGVGIGTTLIWPPVFEYLAGH